MPYDPEIGEHICERIATEPVSLGRIVADGKKPESYGARMPGVTTVFKWLDGSDEFAKNYTRAREAQADLLFDETLEIADDSANDWEERKHFAGDDESPQVNGEAIARAKLRIDTRKWMAGKLRPKKYGEKLDIDQTTKLDVTDPVKALLEQVVTRNQRLMPKTEE